MKVNGLLIDCSRLLEPRKYYFRLLEFMAQWKLNTLVLHFSDDDGCALRLPGFNHLAMPHAFTPREIRQLIRFAQARGIEIIPELEAFGHTRFITDHPRHRHLFAGTWTRARRFNALDPLHKDTHALMRRLMTAVATLFPSRYMHLGCDEVDLKAYCRKKGLVVEDVWVAYVNRMIALAHRLGKTPLIWADHVSGNAEIARKLRKDVVLIDWRYGEDVKDGELSRLRKKGFRRLLAGPAIACFKHRFLPTAPALENTARMAGFARRHKAEGVITTIWSPGRYLQNAMYYGMAYSACAVRQGGHPDLRAFNRRYARQVFGTGLPPALDSFLGSWTDLAIDHRLLRKIVQRPPTLTREELHRLRTVNRLGTRVLCAARAYAPRVNHDIWEGMVLAAECAWLCSEGLLLRYAGTKNAARKERYNRLLHELRGKMDADWNQTRYRDDPQKTKPRFPGATHHSAILLVRRLWQAR